VPGRRKCRKPPSGGQKRPFIGPEPQPKPASSYAIAHRIAFWNAIGVNAHPPGEKKPGWPAENDTKNAQPPAKSSRYLAQYAAITPSGFGCTCAAQVRHTRRTRSGNGAPSRRAGS
jgi:hypothetical protein